MSESNKSIKGTSYEVEHDSVGSKNEPVNYVLGNYFLKPDPGNYQAEEASNISDIQPDLLQFSWADKIYCNIEDLVSDVVSISSSVGVGRFWILNFDGSKTLEG